MRGQRPAEPEAEGLEGGVVSCAVEFTACIGSDERAVVALARITPALADSKALATVVEQHDHVVDKNPSR